MKKLIILFILFSCVGIIQKSHAQTQKDSFDYVFHSGVAYPVFNKTTLSLYEIKSIVRDNPEAFKHFKKARRLRNLSIGLEVLSGVSLVVALISENESHFWIGLGVSSVITGLNISLITDPYNEAVLDCVKTYNKSLRVNN